MLAASAPWISVSPSARSAAMEKAIAMRWSSPESITPPRSRLSAGNVHAVLVLGHLRAHRAQVLHHQRNAVALLHAQLFGIADAHAVLRCTERWRRSPAARRSAAPSRYPRSPCRAAARPRFTWIVPTISPCCSFTSSTLITPPIAEITSSSARACRVHAQRIQHQVGVLKQQRSAEEERRRGHIARHRRVDGVQLLPTLNRKPVVLALQLRAKRPQRMLGVVARAHLLGDRRRALRLQSREQHGGLHLRAGDGCLEVNRLAAPFRARSSARGLRSARCARPSAPAACGCAPSAAP